MKNLLAGFVRLHALHRAAEGPITGVWTAKGLRRHGYRIGPGTLYPLLRGLEKEGYLRSQETRRGRLRYVHYAAMAEGRRDLKKAREKLRERFRERVEETGHGPEPKPTDQAAGR